MKNKLMLRGDTSWGLRLQTLVQVNMGSFKMQQKSPILGEIFQTCSADAISCPSIPAQARRPH